METATLTLNQSQISRQIFRPQEALERMGLIYKANSVFICILNMKRAGLLKSSYKINNRWHITEDDIVSIREKIMQGEYKPSAKYSKLNK